MLAFWCTAVAYFASNVTDWTLTPAESRALNSECNIAGFFDDHDTWHLLSAYGLFFTLMFLLSLDDDLTLVPRCQIAVF